jgi:hypothetical protein
MLRIVLIEMQQGRFRPSQWFRDARESPGYSRGVPRDAVGRSP